MADEHAAALRLLQGLVDDPELRARFRADPTGVAAEAGLPRVGRELADRANGPLGLEVRESRSGLAGVLMAAAVEGLALGGLLEHAADAHAASPAEGMPEGRMASSVEPVRDSGHLPPDQDGDTAGRSSPPYVPDGDDDAEDDENEPDENEPDENEPDENEDERDEDDDERDEDEPDDDEAPSPRRNLAPAQPGGDDEPDAPAADVPDLPDGPQAYPGDDAPRRERAAWMAAEARDRGLPPELPVMAALVESGLKNVNYGDADRRGFFQMRKRVWDQGPFAGFADHPPLQLLWFISQATTIRTQKLALGLADPAKTPSRYGAWIADVERPPEQYRGRFQLRYDEARGLLGLDAAKVTGTAAPAAPTP